MSGKEANKLTTSSASKLECSDDMKANGLSKKSGQVYARLGKDLSATSNAVTAAEIILNAANELIGWEACYLILYDPEQGRKPRPLLTIDTINNKRVIEHDAAPEKPSENMLKAIRENGYLSLHEAENVPSACFPYKVIKRKLILKVRLKS